MSRRAPSHGATHAVTVPRNELVFGTPAWVGRVSHLLHLRTDDGELFRYPDIGVGPDRGGGTATSGTLTVTALARVTVPPPFEWLRMSYMEIRDTDSEELVTVIELLSPSNKIGDDRRAYQRKG